MSVDPILVHTSRYRPSRLRSWSPAVYGMWAPFWFTSPTVGSPTFGLCTLPLGVKWKFPPSGSQPFSCVDPDFGLWFPPPPCRCEVGITFGSCLTYFVCSPSGSAPPVECRRPLPWVLPLFSMGNALPHLFVLPLLCTLCSSHREVGGLTPPAVGSKPPWLGLFSSGALVEQGSRICSPG